MPANEVHKNDVGTIFRVTLKDGNTVVDLSSATALYFLFKRPDGTSIQRTAVYYTNGADGIIQYTMVSGDLSQDGRWRLQPYVTLPSGSWYGDIYEFDVHKNVAEVS